MIKSVINSMKNETRPIDEDVKSFLKKSPFSKRTIKKGDLESVLGKGYYQTRGPYNFYIVPEVNGTKTHYWVSNNNDDDITLSYDQTERREDEKI